MGHQEAADGMIDAHQTTQDRGKENKQSPCAREVPGARHVTSFQTK